MKRNKTKVAQPMLERKALTKEEKAKEKRAIVFYAGSMILVSSLFMGGISIMEATTDHTKEICPITRIGHNYVENSKCNLTRGDLHQMDAMEKDFADRGKDVDVVYDPHYSYDTAFSYVPIEFVTTQLSDGTRVYSLPPNAMAAQGHGENSKGYIRVENKCNVEPAYVAYTNENGEEVVVLALNKNSGK